MLFCQPTEHLGMHYRSHRSKERIASYPNPFVSSPNQIPHSSDFQQTSSYIPYPQSRKSHLSDRRESGQEDSMAVEVATLQSHWNKLVHPNQLPDKSVVPPHTPTADRHTQALGLAHFHSGQLANRCSPVHIQRYSRSAQLW